jgi:hypothetical protein
MSLQGCRYVRSKTLVEMKQYDGTFFKNVDALEVSTPTQQRCTEDFNQISCMRWQSDSKVVAGITTVAESILLQISHDLPQIPPP